MSTITAGILIAFAGSIFSGLTGMVGWLVARRTYRVESTRTQDTSQDAKLLVLELEVKRLTDSNNRMSLQLQTVREELSVLGEIFNRHETWHQRAGHTLT